MGIAEPVIGRAFARPVGSTHPTKLFRIGIGKPPAGFSNLRARRNLTGGIPLRTSGSAIGLVLSCDDCNEVNVGRTAAVARILRWTNGSHAGTIRIVRCWRRACSSSHQRLWSNPC